MKGGVLLDIGGIAAAAKNRHDFWCTLLGEIAPRHVAEVGVWRGEFAARVLAEVPSIETYHMIDPWRRLDSWNKPWNLDDTAFSAVFSDMKARVSEFSDRVVIHRGTTTEVLSGLPDDLDFIYIDGDHTLRGISIDLIAMWPKLRTGGWLGGDDLMRNIWQHGPEYEPGLVFPFVMHFAEGTGVPLTLLPFQQYLMRKTEYRDFHLRDHTSHAASQELLAQVRPRGRRAALRELLGG